MPLSFDRRGFVFTRFDEDSHKAWDACPACLVQLEEVIAGFRDYTLNGGTGQEASKPEAMEPAGVSA